MDASCLRYFCILSRSRSRHVISRAASQHSRRYCRALRHATLDDSVTFDKLTNSYNRQFEGISKVKTPAVKAFKATYQGRYTLRDCEGEPLSMTAMETITDLLLEIMEVTQH